jgi:hypothetical protein
MYLSDLTFIEEGSNDFLPLDENQTDKSTKPVLTDLINFAKR